MKLLEPKAIAKYIQNNNIFMKSEHFKPTLLLIGIFLAVEQKHVRMGDTNFKTVATSGMEKSYTNDFSYIDNALILREENWSKLR